MKATALRVHDCLVRRGCLAHLTLLPGDKPLKLRPALKDGILPRKRRCKDVQLVWVRMWMMLRWWEGQEV